MIQARAENSEQFPVVGMRNGEKDEQKSTRGMESHKKLSMNHARVAGVSRNAQRHRSRSIKRHSKQSGVFVVHGKPDSIASRP